MTIDKTKRLSKFTNDDTNILDDRFFNKFEIALSLKIYYSIVCHISLIKLSMAFSYIYIFKT